MPGIGRDCRTSCHVHVLYQRSSKATSDDELVLFITMPVVHLINQFDPAFYGSTWSEWLELIFAKLFQVASQLDFLCRAIWLVQGIVQQEILAVPSQVTVGVGPELGFLRLEK